MTRFYGGVENLKAGRSHDKLSACGGAPLYVFRYAVANMAAKNAAICDLASSRVRKQTMGIGLGGKRS